MFPEHVSQAVQAVKDGTLYQPEYDPESQKIRNKKWLKHEGLNGFREIFLCGFSKFLSMQHALWSLMAGCALRHLIR